jgi:hypothetical protein
MGSQAAKSGAEMQANAAMQSAQLQKQMFDTQNEQQKPYREAGYSALSDIAGMKPYLTHQFDANDFAQGIDPGYAFRKQQGEEATNRASNVAGGQISGNSLKALQDYSQGLASQEYGNAFNRYQTQRGNIYNTLASIAGLGQTSLGQTGTQSVAVGANIGNAISNAGSAMGAGTVGAANAISGGVQGAGNAYFMSNLLKPQAQAQNPNWNPAWGTQSNPVYQPGSDSYVGPMPLA